MGRWWLAPEHRDILIGPRGLRLEEWLQSGQARIVKQGPHRTVYRVELPEMSFHVKRNLESGHWARKWFCRSKARREHERARAVAERGIPTYQPLAIGETHSPIGLTESIFISRSLENAHEFQEFASRCVSAMPPRRQARLRQRLARDLGEFVARLHQAGIRHDDFHPANILARLENDDTLRLYLIDLNSVQVGAPLSWKQSRQNLVILNRWFMLRASRSDRFRFWKAYCRQRGEQFNRLMLDGADDLEQRTLASNLAFWRERDKRCLTDNRYYRRFRLAGVTGRAVTELDIGFLSALAADLDEPFRRPGAKSHKDTFGSSVVDLEVSIAGVKHTWIYKRFRDSPWSAFCAGLFRSSAALRSWVLGQGLRERGLPTARPLALFERRARGWGRDRYLLTEKIHDAQDLHRFLAGLAALPAADAVKAVRRQMDQVAAVLRELHERRLSHRDLKAANILVGHAGDSTHSPLADKARTTTSHGLLPFIASSVWLIDLVGMRRHGRLSRARRAQNLSRLNASFPLGGSLTRTDRLRFLRTYLRWNLHGNAHWKDWWRAIDVATRKKIRRNQKRGRPLA